MMEHEASTPSPVNDSVISSPLATTESDLIDAVRDDGSIREEGMRAMPEELTSSDTVSIESHIISALTFGDLGSEEGVQGAPEPPREMWTSLRSVGTSLRGWACVVGSAAQGAVQEVGRSTSLLASQLSNTFSHESTIEQLTNASDRARSIGGRVAERAVAAGGELNDALQLFDGSSTSSSSTAGSVPRRSYSDSLIMGLSGLRDEAQPIIHGLKYSPLSAIDAFQGEASTSDHTREKRAIVSMLARDCWELWIQKHEALTRCESLYALLLADSRRTSMLAAELASVQELIQTLTYSEEDETPAASTIELDLQQSDGQSDGQLTSVKTNRQEALDKCRKSVTAQAKDAVDSFKERLQHYPSGRACSSTMQFKIARSESDIQEVLKAFELKVAEEVQEALSQIQEIILTPDLQTLSASLTRRVDFWEREIEDNWSMWTSNSCHFHESCEGVAETWSKLQETIYEILVWIADEANLPSSQTSPIAFVVPLLDVNDIRQHKIWEELYSVLVDAASMVAALGAWIDYHNLRGDGVTSQQARDLFEAMLYALDLAFEGRFSYKFDGRDAVLDRLTRNASWKLVIDHCSTHVDCAHWWAPDNWPARVSPKDVQQMSANERYLLRDLPRNDKRRDCYDMLFKKHLSKESESPPVPDGRLPSVHNDVEIEAEESTRPIFVGPGSADVGKLASVDEAIVSERAECA